MDFLNLNRALMLHECQSSRPTTVRFHLVLLAVDDSEMATNVVRNPRSKIGRVSESRRSQDSIEVTPAVVSAIHINRRRGVTACRHKLLAQVPIGVLARCSQATDFTEYSVV